MPSITLTNLTRRFPGGTTIGPLTLSITPGEHLVIVGPSGTGKTTLLRLIAGLETPEDGTIHFDDRDITATAPHLRHVALVAQRPALYPHMNVRGNLAAGVKLRQSSGRIWRRLRGQTDPVSTVELDRRVQEAASWLGLTPLLNRRIQDLSGGEQQRVVLGRAVVSQHPVWLLDEPLAHLDPAVRQTVRAELLLLRDRLNPTMIEVTHDPVDALCLGHRVAVMQVGRIEQVGPPAEVYTHPATRGVATSLGWPPMNFIEGTRAAPGGERETIGVRAEHVAIGSGQVDLGSWKLERVDPLGPNGLWTLSQNGQRLQRWAQPGDTAAPAVQLHVSAEHAHRFDNTTGIRLKD